MASIERRSGRILAVPLLLAVAACAPRSDIDNLNRRVDGLAKDITALKQEVAAMRGESTRAAEEARNAAEAARQAATAANAAYERADRLALRLLQREGVAPRPGF